jgi:hypothetical protein
MYTLSELRGSTVFVGSDYGGQHEGADFQVLSFLLADLDTCGDWESIRQDFRANILRSSRRISYKKLSAAHKQRTLLPLLMAANTIPGLIVSILIDRRIGSLFMDSGKLPINHPDFAPYAHWKRGALEKLLRAVHFVSFFVSGLLRPGQNVVWISDEDEIAPNPDRISQVTQLFRAVSSHYLQFNMGSFRFGTTASDDGSRSLEDLLSIPDLVAGALSDSFTTMNKDLQLPDSKLYLFAPQNIPLKARYIMDWFSDNLQPLRRAVYLLQPAEVCGTIIKQMTFIGSRELGWQP